MPFFFVVIVAVTMSVTVASFVVVEHEGCIQKLVIGLSPATK